MKNIEPKTLKGFRDFLPQEAKKRQYVINALKEVFELYGFEPLETPALEYEEILLGKYGDEGDKLMYRFTDNGDRKVALRYDQTVPLARVVAQYGDKLPTPFKRYQIQPVWRAENTQKGRFREFLQCDCDIVGTSSFLSDAEIITVAAKCLEKLGFKNFKSYVNSRKILAKIMQQSSITPEKQNSTLQTLDKIDKGLSIDDLDKELALKGVGEQIFSTKLDPAIYNVTYNWQTEDPTLKQIYDLAIQAGTGRQNIDFKSSVVRGLDYYTDFIFEVKIEGYESGSVAGGGRYDNLIGMFAGKQIPAVGFAFGFDRLIEAMEQLNLFPADLTTTKVLVTVFSKELLPKSIEICSFLRESSPRAQSRGSKNINTELWLDPETKLDKQLKYANQKGIPYVAVIGPDEAKNNQVTVKNMRTGKQETIPQNQLLRYLHNYNPQPTKTYNLEPVT